MSETNQGLAKRWFEEVWNQQRRETIAELLHPDVVFHERGEHKQSSAAFYEYYDRMWQSFSDVHITVHDTFSDGDKVCVRWSGTLTHTGTGLGVPPTGKTVETTGISVMRVADGKLIEGWQDWDMLRVLEAIHGLDKSPTYLTASA